MSRFTVPAVSGVAILVVAAFALTPAFGNPYFGNTYDGTGRMSVKGGKKNMSEKVEANLVLSKSKLDVDQTNGKSPLSGTLRLDKKVGNKDTSVNVGVKGKLANKRDSANIDKGKFKIKENRKGIVSLGLSVKGEVTKGSGKGGTLKLKVKG